MPQLVETADAATLLKPADDTAGVHRVDSVHLYF